MKALKAAGVAVGCVGALWLADSAVAMHAEHAVSARVEELTRLETPPDVYIGGLPYVAAAVTGTVPLLEVRSSDVEVPQLGMVNAQTTLRDVHITPQQVWTGDYDGAVASTLSRSLSLDGVALGRLLGMTDLNINNPNNISPSGGNSAEAELTGTIPGDELPTTVQVELRLEGPMFYMRPIDAPEGHVHDAFYLELDTRRLPLPAQATKVSLRGGTINVEVQRRNVELHLDLLSPLEIDGDYDKDGKQITS
ncbi:DUF2993 domain-containing protein [Corynebacterium sp. SA-MJD20WY100]|uniref:LmeA family phospholipid-binding protein n=1 Tax=Corynebacterium sp. SA-MJD20WY100 TaxID=3142969 RepID=UPI003221BB57